MVISTTWVWWRLALTIIFGTVWLVFTILDIRRKIAVKKRRKEMEQELREQGMSDEQIKEIMKQKGNLYIYSGKQGSGRSIHFSEPKEK